MRIFRPRLWLFGAASQACGRLLLQQLVSRLCTRRLQDQDRPAKKARSGAPEEPEPGRLTATPLSPEQLDRIERNKAAALLRLAARNVPPGLGESWKQQLRGEFGKPYFIKVGRAGPPSTGAARFRLPVSFLCLVGSCIGCIGGSALLFACFCMHYTCLFRRYSQPCLGEPKRCS